MPRATQTGNEEQADIQDVSPSSSGGTDPTKAKTSDQAKSEQTASIEGGAKRTFEVSQDIIHDLFELEASTMQRNVSHNRANPVLHGQIHQHMFHSHDKHGKKLDFCTPIGGHTHRVSVTEGKGEKLVAKVEAARIRIGSAENFDTNALPAGCEVSGGDVIHVHTHPVTYIRSEKLVVPKR